MGILGIVLIVGNAGYRSSTVSTMTRRTSNMLQSARFQVGLKGLPFRVKP